MNMMRKSVRESKRERTRERTRDRARESEREKEKARERKRERERRRESKRERWSGVKRLYTMDNIDKPQRITLETKSLTASNLYGGKR